MPHRAYYDYDHSRNDDEIMYSALTEPSPCPAVASELCMVVPVRTISGLGIPQK